MQFETLKEKHSSLQGHTLQTSNQVISSGRGNMFNPSWRKLQIRQDEKLQNEEYVVELESHLRILRRELPEMSPEMSAPLRAPPSICDKSLREVENILSVVKFKSTEEEQEVRQLYRWFKAELENRRRQFVKAANFKLGQLGAVCTAKDSAWQRFSRALLQLKPNHTQVIDPKLINRKL